MATSLIIYAVVNGGGWPLDYFVDRKDAEESLSRVQQPPAVAQFKIREIAVHTTSNTWRSYGAEDELTRYHESSVEDW